MLLGERLFPETVDGMHVACAEGEADVRRNQRDGLPFTPRAEVARLDPWSVLDRLGILPRLVRADVVPGDLPAVGPDFGRAGSRFDRLVAAIADDAEVNRVAGTGPFDAIVAAMQVNPNLIRLFFRESSRVEG